MLWLKRLRNETINKKLIRLNLRRLSELYRLLEKDRDRYKRLYYQSIKVEKQSENLTGEEKELYEYIKKGKFTTKVKAQEDLGLTYYKLNNLLEILKEKQLMR